MRKQQYWIGSRPSNIKRWQNAEAGTLLDLTEYADRLFELYRRYVKQWNDIELNHARSLSEHTHRVCGAQVVGSTGKFILHFNTDRDNGWILELAFSRGFRTYYPGLSTGLNTLQSLGDIKHAVLHWRGNGRISFDEWLIQERTENGAKGEWAEYKA